MKLALKGGALAVIALAITFAAIAGDARANPALSMSYARQQMQKFVQGTLVQGSERKFGRYAVGKIDSCWRISSSRIHCHVTLDTHKENPVDGSDMRYRCSGTWAAFNDQRYFRIKNVTSACF